MRISLQTHCMAEREKWEGEKEGREGRKEGRREGEREEYKGGEKGGRGALERDEEQ